MFAKRFLSFVLLVLLAVGAWAQSSPPRRVALVIGNSGYPSGALDNPKNDAKSVAETLKKLGFDVELKIDVTKADFDAARKRFGIKAEKAEVAALFYAGHGMQDGGLNYLVPIDAKPKTARDLKWEMVRLDDIIDDMANAKVKLVFFDACRDNPLSRSFSRGGSRGLAPPVETSGTMISFATKHGNTASDGEGGHSPYTNALLAELENPAGVEIEVLLKKVSQSVKKNTGGEQEPWKYGSLDGDFYFIAGPAPGSAAAAGGESRELEYWSGAKQANSITAYQLYLQKYPAGHFAALAKENMARLKQGNKAAAPDAVALEQTYWDRIKDSREVADFNTYLRDYPKGVHVPEARLIVNQLKREGARPAVVASQAVAPVPAVTSTPSTARGPVSTTPATLSVGKSFRDCTPGCPELVVLPAGSFQMGSPTKEIERLDREGPQHLVQVPAFAMGKYAVTFSEWDACVLANACSQNPDDVGWGRGNRPVVRVSWEDANQYVQWLSKRTGQTYRLPSEAEWEYAARAGTTTPFNTGECINTSQANYNGNFDYAGCGAKTGNFREKTVMVGTYPANAFGLHEMHGNVWQWTQDCWNDSYADAPADGSAWTTGDCKRRVVRGGSWDDYPTVLRSARRYWGGQGGRYTGTGFRVVRGLAGK